MYPYKEEIISSAKAFVLAWALLLTPILSFAYINHWVNPPIEIDN